MDGKQFQLCAGVWKEGTKVFAIAVSTVSKEWKDWKASENSLILEQLFSERPMTYQREQFPPNLEILFKIASLFLG